MITYFREILSNRDIVSRILFTFIILMVFRLLANVPLPGIDMQVYSSEFVGKSTSEANYLLTIFTGGQLDTPSIVGLGIGVYITASIVIQLLSSVVPRLEELSKEGARGKQLIDQYTRLLTIPLAILYSVAYIILLTQQPIGTDAQGNPLFLVSAASGNLSITKILFIALVLTAGSLVVMWLSELITERGIANGSSVMIMLGILATLPVLVRNDVTAFNPIAAVQRAIANRNPSDLLDKNLLVFVAITIGMVVLVGAIVFITESTRKVAIQYARRQRTGNVQESFLPLKLNQTGVMPIIFASSLLTMPQLLVPLLLRVVQLDSPIGRFLINLQSSFLFDNRSNGYLVTYFMLIIVFALFYVFIAFKPEQVAENLQKSGGFIPGVRPGKATEQYLVRILMRLTVVGAIFLGFIALIPILVGNLMVASVGQSLSVFSAIGGTSILIVIGVVLEVLRQIDAYRASQNYEKYL